MTVCSHRRQFACHGLRACATVHKYAGLVCAASGLSAHTVASLLRVSVRGWLALLVCVLPALQLSWAQQAHQAATAVLPTSVQASAPITAATIASEGTTLGQAFAAAWQRQPEAQSQAMRGEGAAATRQAAASWTPEPASLELSTKSDRLNQNYGSREDAVGLAFPLWLSGERSRTAALGDAAIRVNASRTLAAQLRTAASVRESYWQWQRARGDAALARERLSNTQQLAGDVARRVKAGDLARADQHQADAAQATAEAAQAEALGALAGAAQQLRALTGAPPALTALPPVSALVPASLTEAAPDETADDAAWTARHPALIELVDRVELARRTVELARVQTRANPELTLATARDRGERGAYQRNITLGIHIPFGSDSRNQARVAFAQAELIEAEGQLALAQLLVLAERDSAAARLEAARAQLQAGERRAQLARESHGFFQKSYQMGETDLPTRLRIELEAQEAERQASRARVDLAAAVSALRQALGLLPE